MSKVAEYVNLKQNCLLLQPEGYNPSGSFKDNGMFTAITHAKATGVNMIICASTGNTSASAMAANENMRCEVYIPKRRNCCWKTRAAFQFGAQVIQVDGNFDDAQSIVGKGKPSEWIHGELCESI